MLDVSFGIRLPNALFVDHGLADVGMPRNAAASETWGRGSLLSRCLWSGSSPIHRISTIVSGTWYQIRGQGVGRCPRVTQCVVPCDARLVRCNQGIGKIFLEPGVFEWAYLEDGRARFSGSRTWQIGVGVTVVQMIVLETLGTISSATV